MINILSDNYLKNFKLNNAKKNDSVISFNNDVFIFDEIDDLLNPLTNQLNIVDCNINKKDDYFTKIFDICMQFMVKLYEQYNLNKPEYDRIFNDELYFVFKNKDGYKELFIKIIKMLYTDIIKTNIDEYINNIFIENVSLQVRVSKYHFKYTLFFWYHKLFINKFTIIIKKKGKIFFITLMFGNNIKTIIGKTATISEENIPIRKKIREVK